MEVIRSSISLSDYRQEIVNALQSEDYLIFLDTNVFAWTFQLNEDAATEFFRWLSVLESNNQLRVPAWVVHEYNTHLVRQDTAFFSSHTSLTKQLLTHLKEFENLAQLMAGENSAKKVGYTSKQNYLDKITSASADIKSAIEHVAKMESDRHNSIEETIERLMNSLSIDSDIHSISASAWAGYQSRSANRLSPGFKDAATKMDNLVGDLIIWQEILLYCQQCNARNVILITNDRKTDWVYSPLRIVLPNGKSVSGTSESMRLVKLPKPDLLSEFKRNGNGENLHILTIEMAMDCLSSTELNWNCQDFRHLALAIKGKLEGTPTDQIIEWFIRNPDRQSEAVKNICYWQHSPGEVDMDAFKEWTIEHTPGVKHDKVDWSIVFCEFFI